MEETTKEGHSTSKTIESGSSGSLPKRKFAPQLVESSSRSSRKPENHRSGAPEQSQPRSRIKPQLIETTKDHRGGKSGKSHSGNPSLKQQEGKAGNATVPDPKSSPKKFTPQLIETAKRSYRQAGPDSPSTLPQSRNRIRIAGWSVPLNPRPEHEEDSRFSYANLVRRRDSRRHSFRVPDLPAIPSSSSDDSLPSPVTSFSTTPTFTTDKTSQPCNAQAPSPDNTGGHFMDIDLYSLPARTRERLLKERALAAFPNEQVYQPVAHFAIDKEDDDDTGDDDSSVETTFRSMTLDLARFRRESSVDLTWELEEMRRHKEESEMRAREKRFASGHSPFSAAALAAKRMMEEASAMDGITGGWQKGADATNKRRAVRPPMLGGDIIFPQCQSPQTTRCETDQTPTSHKDDNGGAPEQQVNSLWIPEVHCDLCDEPGLWNGTCKRPSGTNLSALSSANKAAPETGPEDTDCEKSVTATGLCTNNLAIPPTKSPRPQDKKKYEDKQALEEEINQEFNDSFVTQIYNYLSLGYPCLARDYDEEFSSVTGISVEELRKDDQHANAKGYLGAPEGPSETDGKCMRWTALKLYIHEWARQQPRASSPGSGLEGWGVRARGSWAV
ncbi:uncharacterized protein CIMG_02287 [Coccidioides immitis RS]|uniref:Uncharacterized protein n=1 Tax=Coccidioides immitis (strain RS) TaxID=246410 RepID=A0A0E1S0R6_COCIM|nr:uncharacterized protein CIMG_02287 [Coccidioides immitis RS]EAS36933.1 hypothetical protein CIMG_02287 [Coccidioides immitis RS]